MNMIRMCGRCGTRHEFAINQASGLCPPCHTLFGERYHGRKSDMSRPLQLGEQVYDSACCWVCGRNENFEEVGKDPDTNETIYTCGDCCEEIRILYAEARKEFGL